MLNLSDFSREKNGMLIDFSSLELRINQFLDSLAGIYFLVTIFEQSAVG